MNKMMDKIEMICEQCVNKFISYMWIEAGCSMEFCCSDDCYHEYYSVEGNRDRKLKLILDEV